MRTRTGSVGSVGVVLASLLLAARPSRALFEDEVGVSDFLLSTAGHGLHGVTYASSTSDGSAVITSSSHAYPLVPDGGGDGSGDGEDDPFGFVSDHAKSSSDGCYVTARSSSSGSLLWRRDACSRSASSSSGGIRHAVLTSSKSKAVFTLDDAGVFRGWDESTGALKFDIGIAEGSGPTAGAPRLMGLDLDAHSVVGAVSSASDSDNEILTFRSAQTGEPIADGSIVKAADALAEAKVKQPKSGSAARILGIVPSGQHGKAAVLVGWVYADGEGRSIASGSGMTFLEITVSSASTYEIGQGRAVKIGGEGSRLGSVALKAYTMRIFSMAGKTHVMAIAAAAEDVITITIDLAAGSTTARRTGATELHPLWTSLASIHPPTNTVGAAMGGYDGYVTVAGDDDRYPTTRRTAALYRFDPTTGKIGKQLYEGPNYHEGEEETQDDAVIRCADVKLAFEYDSAKESTSVNAYRVKGEEVVDALAVSGDGAASLPNGASLRTDHTFVLKCSASGASILATATGGTTLYLAATFQSSSVSLNLAWSAEESLGAVSSATFLDESHVPVTAPEEEEDEEEALIHGLSFPSRLASQADSLKSFLAGGVATYLQNALFSSGDGKSRDAAFGFSKVAVLLNSRQHMLVGSELGGQARGTLRWTKRLHPSAAWHRVVHGGPSARSGVNGGQDGHALHGHEILVLSYVPAETSARGYAGEGEAEGAGTLRWTCLDGLTGRVHLESKIALGGEGRGVAQIVPLHSPHHAAGECRQMAALLREDDSVTVVPDTPHAREVLGDVIRTANGGNGMYTHTLNRSTGAFHSLRIGSAEPGSKAVLVGEASFSPDVERVVSVAYPRRNEVIQSPATILGDDSLLLKYLNPHICVVITEATPAFLARMDSDDEDGGGSGSGDGGFYRALGTEGKGSGGDRDAGKTKPLGATKPGEDSPSAPPAAKAPSPSLFVNVLDTVSGRVLHRASHSHLPDTDSDSRAAAATTKSLTNVPVLISENWIIYAFPNARTQRTELGVLTLHEGMIDKTGITMTSSPDQDLSFSSLTSPRPIVLSKTYGLQVPVKALGITTTRGGISVKHVLLSTGPKGSVSAVDRRTLDPRRPTGEPKQSEKAEGLVKYFPLVPLTTKFTPSYNLEVRDATVIESAAAQVESASLTLAFGGPDVFYARLSPSRGFDLLPDSFNRPLLSAVVLGLVAMVVTLKGMSNKKMVVVGWT